MKIEKQEGKSRDIERVDMPAIYVATQQRGSLSARDRRRMLEDAGVCGKSRRERKAADQLTCECAAKS